MKRERDQTQKRGLFAGLVSSAALLLCSGLFFGGLIAPQNAFAIDPDAFGANPGSAPTASAPTTTTILNVVAPGVATFGSGTTDDLAHTSDTYCFVLKAGSNPVYSDTRSCSTTHNATTNDFTGLTPNTNYYIRYFVRALGAGASYDPANTYVGTLGTTSVAADYSTALNTWTPPAAPSTGGSVAQLNTTQVRVTRIDGTGTNYGYRVCNTNCTGGGACTGITTAAGLTADITVTSAGLTLSNPIYGCVRSNPHGSSNQSATGFISQGSLTFDDDNPTAPSVRDRADDGTYASGDQDFDNDTTIYATWSGASDPSSAVASYTVYFYNEGTSACVANGSNIGNAVATYASEAGPSKAYTATAGNTYTFQVRTYDTYGNNSYSACSDGIVVDTAGPNAPTVRDRADDTTYASGDQDYDNDTTIYMTWSGASDGGSGIASYSYYIYDESGTACVDNGSASGSAVATASTGTTQSASYVGTNGKTYKFQVRTYDNSGNSSYSSCSDGIMIDTTAPTAPGVRDRADDGTYASGDLDYDNDTTIYFTWSGASDAASGIASYTVYVYNEATSACVDNGSNIGGAVSTYGSEAGPSKSIVGANGSTYKFQIRTHDNAGNSSYSSCSDGITIDTSNPTAPSTRDRADDTTYASGDEDYDTDTTIYMTWSGGADAGSGVASYTYYIYNQGSSACVDDGSNVGNAVATASTGTTENASYVGSDGNTYAFQVLIYNNAGGSSYSACSDGIGIETTAPTAPTVIDRGDDFVYASGDEDYDDDLTIFGAWSGASAGSGIASYTYYYYEESTTSCADNGSNAGSAQFTGSTGTSANVQLGGATDGKTYKYQILVTSNAGNTAYSSCSDGILVDTTAPTATTVIDRGDDSTFASGDEDYDNDTTVYFTWQGGGDAQSAVASYTYYIYNEGTSACADNGSNIGNAIANATQGTTNISYAGTTGATYKAQVMTTNNSGLTVFSSCSDGITIDTTAPTVSIGIASDTNVKSGDTFTVPLTVAGACAANVTYINIRDQDISYTYSGTATGCTATVSNGDTASPTITIDNCSGDGTIETIVVATGRVTDCAANANATTTKNDTALATDTGASNTDVTVDNTVPTIAIGIPDDDGTIGNVGTTITAANSAKSFYYEAVCSDSNSPSLSLAANDVTLSGTTTGCTVSIPSSNSTTAIIKVTGCSGNGDITQIALAAGVCTDGAGKASAATTKTDDDVTIDNTAPTVADVFSDKAAGTYGTGTGIDVYVKFNEQVVVTGTPTIQLETGTTDETVNLSSQTTTDNTNDTIYGTYTVQAGNSSADLDYKATTSLTAGTSIKDLAGNSATLTLAAPAAATSLGANEAIVIDADSPIITSVTSDTADGTYKIGDSITLRVNFNKALDIDNAGPPQLTIETGATDQTLNCQNNVSGVTSITCSYTVQVGDQSADLDYTATNAFSANGATIQDTITNVLDPTLADVDSADTSSVADGDADGISLSASAALVVDGIRPTFTNAITGIAITDSNTVNLTWADATDAFNPAGTFTYTVYYAHRVDTGHAHAASDDDTDDSNSLTQAEVVAAGRTENVTKSGGVYTWTLKFNSTTDGDWPGGVSTTNITDPLSDYLVVVVTDAAGNSSTTANSSPVVAISPYAPIGTGVYSVDDDGDLTTAGAYDITENAVKLSWEKMGNFRDDANNDMRIYVREDGQSFDYSSEGVCPTPVTGSTPCYIDLTNVTTELSDDSDVTGNTKYVVNTTYLDHSTTYYFSVRPYYWDGSAAALVASNAFESSGISTLNDGPIGDNGTELGSIIVLDEDVDVDIENAQVTIKFNLYDRNGNVGTFAVDASTIQIKYTGIDWTDIADSTFASTDLSAYTASATVGAGDEATLTFNIGSTDVSEFSASALSDFQIRFKLTDGTHVSSVYTTMVPILSAATVASIASASSSDASDAMSQAAVSCGTIEAIRNMNGGSGTPPSAPGAATTLLILLFPPLLFWARNRRELEFIRK